MAGTKKRSWVWCWSLVAMILAALFTIVTVVGCPGSIGKRKVGKSRVESTDKKKKKTARKKRRPKHRHATHPHNHSHPHKAGAHHHHPHPHPHMEGPNGHHHPY